MQNQNGKRSLRLAWLLIGQQRPNYRMLKRELSSAADKFTCGSHTRAPM
jgi:hypothetical protein